MSIAWETPVHSSNVSSVGYDADSGELIIKWNSGKTSAYAGVPEGLALELSKAPSVGQMLNSQIKPIYAHRYV